MEELFEMFAGRWGLQRQDPEIPITNYGWLVNSLSKGGWQEK